MGRFSNINEAAVACKEARYLARNESMKRNKSLVTVSVLLTLIVSWLSLPYLLQFTPLFYCQLLVNIYFNVAMHIGCSSNYMNALYVYFGSLPKKQHT